MSRLKTALEAVRMKNRVMPDQSKWLFSSTDNTKFNYNSKYLFLYVLTNHPEIEAWYVINDERQRALLEKRYGAHFLETNTPEGIEKALSCGVWFTSAGLPIYITGLNHNRRIVNLWHGIPLKTIALMDPSLKWTSRLFFKQIFSKNYTDVVTTSVSLSTIMQRSFAVSADKIKVWGQPRCDLVFEDFDRAHAFRVKYPNMPNSGKYVLYAPTFRSGKATKLFPFADFDRQAFEQYLERNQIFFCIRTHISEQTMEDLPESNRIRYLNEDLEEDIMRMLGGFDLLITDYSSIYLDYLLLNRPIVFLPYDRETYETEHGFNFDYDDVTPGRKPGTYREFEDALQAGLFHDSETALREEVRRRFYDRMEPCSEYICQQFL